MGFEMIDRPKLIKKENLNPNQYTVSLLKEAFRVGLMDKQKIYDIQRQVMMILKNLIMRYTKGESTSIKIETAENILNSIYYAIDAYTCSFYYPEDCITILKEKNIREIYEKGMECVVSCLAETKAFYEKLVQKKIDVPLVIYNDTIDEALPEFFRNYGVVFDAHNTMCSMDYPLVFGDMDLQGIYYIKQYLENLEVENLFCSFLSMEDVLKTLRNYGMKYKIDYKEWPINLFEILISSAIFSILSGNSADRLIISRFQYEMLEKKLYKLNSREINFIINEAVETILSDLSIDQQKLRNYIYRYKTIFIQRLIIAVENRNLHNIVLINEEDKLNEEHICFKDGEKMSDDAFRTIIRKISECPNTAEKMKIITSEVKSLEDFIDVLNADCLYGDEYEAVFSRLSDMFFGNHGDGPIDSEKIT